MSEWKSKWISADANWYADVPIIMFRCPACDMGHRMVWPVPKVPYRYCQYCGKDNGAEMTREEIAECTNVSTADSEQ